MNTITFSSFLVALFTSERVVVGFQSAVPRVRGLRPRKRSMSRCYRQINAGALNRSMQTLELSVVESFVVFRVLGSDSRVA